MVIAAGVVVGRLVGNRTGLPDAAVYVVLGVAAGAIPGVSGVELSPDVVLLLFLPPLIYYAAFFSDLRESLRNLVAVLGQAVGLVVATAAVAASLLLAVFPDVGWAAAIALGAALAPPDPVAAGSVLQRLGVPRRLVTVLETEGLINDGVALTLPRSRWAPSAPTADPVTCCCASARRCGAASGSAWWSGWSWSGCGAGFGTCRASSPCPS
jgi:CPA1 family monovalent cation:H+ antiporter